MWSMRICRVSGGGRCWCGAKSVGNASIGCGSKSFSLKRQCLEYVGLAERVRTLVPGSVAESSQQRLHGDFNPRNVLCGAGSWTLLEWEDSFIGPRVFDIAKAVVYFCNYPMRAGAARSASHLVAGYGSIRPLDEAELRSVAHMALADVAADLMWLVSAIVHDDDRFERFIETDLERLRTLVATNGRGTGVEELFRELSASASGPRQKG